MIADSDPVHAPVPPRAHRQRHRRHRSGAPAEGIFPKLIDSQALLPYRELLKHSIPK